jgi:GNAT superfamily N-acetyltransferase
MQTPSESTWQVVCVDYRNPLHASGLTELMQCYACDPMGGGEPLPDPVLEALPGRLAALPHALSFLAIDGSKAIGLINVFEGFSTFKARPLLNIHDVIVAPDYRGRGVAKALLRAVEAEALRLGCCKLTLEVLTGNVPAANAYRAYGFAPYQLEPGAGVAEFWQKFLP